MSFRVFLVQSFKKPLLLSWFAEDPITFHFQYIYRAFWNLPLYILIPGLKGPLSNALLLQFLPLEDKRHFCEGIISAGQISLQFLIYLISCGSLRITFISEELKGHNCFIIFMSERMLK